MNMAITVIAMRERIKLSWWPTSSNDAQIKDGKDRENDFHAKKLGTTTYRSTLMLAMVMIDDGNNGDDDDGNLRIRIKIIA